MIFIFLNLKGIVTVDPVEVTDGDGWKVNFALVTHIRACYNGPLPKFDQDLGNRVSVIFWHKTRVVFQNVGEKKNKSYRHNALHSKSRQGDKYGRPDDGSDPTF